MRSEDARLAVLDHLERDGWVVYERRTRYGQPAMGQFVIVDPSNGGSAWIVRAMVGKRPPRSKRVIVDRRRVGLADYLAIVDPRDGSVSLEPAASVADAGMAA